MIKKFIRRVLGFGAGTTLRVPREKHGVARERISPAAAKVCAVLREAGFSAYVVGGAVRDLLLGITPKDYDVATDARPEQAKPLFRRAIVIGRRFRLVHVMIGAETVEVSTFRSADGDTSEKDEHGRVLRDNVYGTQEGDALRRDFTVNALYYDPATEEVLDFHGGLADLKKRVLRVIGDAETRYREDPVRMLRAVRLAAKLGLTHNLGGQPGRCVSFVSIVGNERFGWLSTASSARGRSATRSRRDCSRPVTSSWYAMQRPKPPPTLSSAGRSSRSLRARWRSSARSCSARCRVPTRITTRRPGHPCPPSWEDGRISRWSRGWRSPA